MKQWSSWSLVKNLLCCVVLQKVVQFLQFCSRNFFEQRSKLILPLLAVTENCELQRWTIQQHKLYVEYRFLGLYIIRNLCISKT